MDGFDLFDYRRSCSCYFFHMTTESPAERGKKPYPINRNNCKWNGKTDIEADFIIIVAFSAFIDFTEQPYLSQYGYPAKIYKKHKS